MTTTDQAAVAISDEEVRKLLPALSEAERATEATAERFVPPRPGILEEASARRHQLVFGRRGVGKSTLLHRVAAGGRESGRAVIFIDVETLRRRPYPDVLIELLKELFDHLDERLREEGWLEQWRRRRLLRRLRELADAMRLLLQEPQAAEHAVRSLRSRSHAVSRRSSIGGGVRLRLRRRRP
jgi:ATPase subunit of ABC transporter with duplicated ATPase domains